MKMLRFQLLTLIILCSPCSADELPYPHNLQELDSNDDRRISISEFEDYFKAAFLRSDYNQDATLNEEEQQRLLENIKAGFPDYDPAKTRARLSDDYEEEEIILPVR